MIEYRKGNLLDVKEGLIAHGVNCRGVMGSGLALAIRTEYPVVYSRYREYVAAQNTMNSSSSRLLGGVLFIDTNTELIYDQSTAPLVIANCFTQDSYGRDKRHVDYEAVAKCFAILNTRACMYTSGPLYIPKIGAGLAGGDWKVISAIIESEYKGDIVCMEL